MVRNRKSPEWTPELPNTIDGLYGNIPAVDLISFNLTNKSNTRRISISLKTDVVEQFAKKLLKTVKKVRVVQERRKKIKHYE